MTLGPHMLTFAVATLAAGWLMALAGLQKSALEWKKRKRFCPSCGREIRTGACDCAAS